MHIAFIDPVDWAYTPDTPLERPLGGSQSALCYLASELARRGHMVSLFNGSKTESECRGMRIAHVTALNVAAVRKSLDVVVVLNAAIGEMLRRSGRLEVPIVYWTQHAHDQPAAQALKRAAELGAWSALVFVSDWQRNHYEQLLGVPAGRCTVLRNCVSPAFLMQELQTPWFITGAAPLLSYASTPFRGLDVLINAFPAIRAAVPDVRLRVFSSMGVYQVDRGADPYEGLYAACRSTAGIDYVGSVGQTELARELAGTAALAYPSTFAETSCITALEAMATGALVIATTLGALPETTCGHAVLLDRTAQDAGFTAAYARLVVDSLQRMRTDPAAADAHRKRQRQFIMERYAWPERAREWEDLLVKLC
jgi:glycosyltransferase involved in cell wall biosynthesis